MATSINNSGITFPDSTTQTTAATGVSLTFNAIGTYAFASGTTASTYQPGTTFASSTIAPCCVAWMGSGNLPIDFFTWGYGISGTWQLMGFNRASYGGYPATLYQRIS